MSRNVILAVVVAAAVIIALYLFLSPQAAVDEDAMPPHATTD